MDKNLKKFKKIAREKLKDNLLELRLFGSQARGDAGQESDYDVLVIVNRDDEEIRDKIYDITADFLINDMMEISPKIISEKEYKRLSSMETPFMNNIKKEGKMI